MAKTTKAAPQAKANANSAAAPAKSTAPVKPTSTKPAAPATTKTTTKPFALTDVTVANVQRARQLRKDDPERFTKFRNFFAASDATTINTKAVNPKVLAYIQETTESEQDIVILLTVAAALTKYGEQELVRRDTLGEMDYLVGSRFGTNGLRSKMQMEHTVGASYVLRLVIGLAPEKRASCQRLKDIVTLDNNLRLVVTSTNQGLKPVSSATAAKTDKVARNRLLQITKQAQSARFQEAMLQVGGQYIYDAIRTMVKQSDASVWDAAKDKAALQPKNIRARAVSPTTQKGGKQQASKPTKKTGAPVQQVKKHLPVEVKTWVQVVPPPAPTVMNASPVKTAAPVKTATPVKNAAPVKNASPVKKAALVKDVAGSVVQSRPAAVVGNTPTITARATTAPGGRSKASRGSAL